MKKINENYFKNSKTEKNSATEIKDILNPDEQILWEGKPKKKAYIFSSIFSMMPIAIIWLLFDGTFIGLIIGNGFFSKAPVGAVIGILAFFAIHMIPVWIWIANMITASKSYKNLEYAFTNKRIIIKSGIIGIDFKNIYYSEIESVNLKVGLIDKMLKVGDIYIKGKVQSQPLFDISDPYFITQRLQEIVIDIKTDIEFPNGFRPHENPGYNTKYTNKQKNNNSGK